MTPFQDAVRAVRKLYPRMSERRAEQLVRAVLEAVAADQPQVRPGPFPIIGKIGEGGEASFADPEE